MDGLVDLHPTISEFKISQKYMGFKLIQKNLSKRHYQSFLEAMAGFDITN